LYSTYVGGSLADNGSSIALDKNSDIVIVGLSLSADFPHAGAVPAFSCQLNDRCFFIASLKPDRSAFNYAGSIGDSLASFNNGETGLVAVDLAGNAYVTGVTDDQHFELTSGVLGPPFAGYPLEGAFVMKIDPTGKLVYSTMIPGNASANPGGSVYLNVFPAGGIYADASGQVTLAGLAGLGLPTTGGVLQPAFPNNPDSGGAQAGYLLQLNANATAVNFATYLTGTDSAVGPAVDASGNY
jgi:Beta-propeller repeat